MNFSALAVLLGAIGTLLGAIASAIHSQRSDSLQAKNEKDEWDKYIYEAVRKDNQDLRDQIESAKAEIEKVRAGSKRIQEEMQKQIDLKTQENESLRRQNVVLTAQLRKYRLKYGEID